MATYLFVLLAFGRIILGWLDGKIIIQSFRVGISKAKNTIIELEKFVKFGKCTEISFFIYFVVAQKKKIKLEEK